MSPAKQPKAQVQWVLFFAFIVSHLMFAAIGVFLPKQAPPDPDTYTVMAPVLAAVSVGELVMMFTLLPKFMPDADYFVTFVLRAALAESVSIFGLVLSFMGAPLEWCAGFWGVGLSTLLFLAPTDKDREAFEARRAG